MKQKKKGDSFTLSFSTVLVCDTWQQMCCLLQAANLNWMSKMKLRPLSIIPIEKAFKKVCMVQDEKTFSIGSKGNGFFFAKPFDSTLAFRSYFTTIGATDIFHPLKCVKKSPPITLDPLWEPTLKCLSWKPEKQIAWTLTKKITEISQLKKLMKNSQRNPKNKTNKNKKSPTEIS